MVKIEAIMKIKFTILLLASSAAIAVAQPPPDGHRPPPRVIAVIDENRDGVLSAEEIANASEALKQLDRNEDGQLTQEELRPPPPRDSSSTGEQE